MENLDIAISPDLPIWLITVIATLVGVFCLFGLFRQMRGAWLRLAAGTLVCLALLNPAVLLEERTPLKTIIPLVIDQTTSQKFNQRQQQTEETLSAVKQHFKQLDKFELREIRVNDQISKTSEISSALFKALDFALQNVPREQIGGAVFITDGQVHDVPENPGQTGIQGPLHVLLTGRDNERDRRLVLKSTPRFGVVGESQELLYEVRETGFEHPTGRVKVSISLDGELITVEEVNVGEESAFVFDVPHGGKNIIELIVETADGEITELNNRAFTTINGIRENLRVLLVSGEPHAGERTWRNLLKSDASVDLVHFTILRPPEKQDGTPINELSLIAFPTRELFIQKIDEFDLIIFDRYKRRGVLPTLYFDNIARYVQDGGAVLVAAGPEYADPSGIGATPLQAVLPALANGRISELPFTPRISDIGQKHPVTRQLDGWHKEKPEWSRWFRTIGVNQRSGEVLMTNEDQSPILMLERMGEGRVALFLSDHVWLWARSFEGGGPHVQLLRRLAHWLMKEPELDEERLTASSNGKTLTVTRQTLGEKPADVEITLPSGELRVLAFEEVESGLWRLSTEVSQIGLYRASNEGFTALAQIGPANPREFADVASTTELLNPVVNATSGSIRRVSQTGVPRIVAVGRNATKQGRGWIGLVDANASVLNGITRIPLFNGLIGLLLLISGFSAMWFREGR